MKGSLIIVARNLLVTAAVVLTGCTSAPPPYGHVVTMKAGEVPPTDYPGPGTVWRLDEGELKRLSPSPLREPPPPPPRPLPPPASYPPPPYPPPPPGYY